MQGGGRSSARETIGRVAPGAVAKKVLKLKSGIEVSHLIMEWSTNILLFVFMW